MSLSHSPITAGIDVGSTGAKAAILAYGEDGALRVVGVAEQPTGWAPAAAGEAVLSAALAQAAIGRQAVASIVGTGYGRVSLPFADRRVTEITCHARGAAWLVPGCRTVLDLGGQDSKLISLNADGSVRDFVMNDKCAAGTGRFIQNMCAAMGIAIEDFGPLAASGTVVTLSSMCAVFAETEVIGLTAQGSKPADLAAGIVASIARRLKSLTGRIPLAAPVAFTGGLARSPELAALMAAGLETDLTVPPLAPYAGAIGAALIAQGATAAAPTTRNKTETP